VGTRQGEGREEIEIVGFRPTQKKWLPAWKCCKLLDEGLAGDNVGLLLRGTEKEDVSAGRWVCSGLDHAAHEFKAEAYVLTKERRRAARLFHRPIGRSLLSHNGLTGDVKLPTDRDVMPWETTSGWTGHCYPSSSRKGLRSRSRRAATRGRRRGHGDIGIIG